MTFISKERLSLIPPFDSSGERVNVIVETPKGSGVKYAFDPETGLFQYSKLLPRGMTFPFAFGFIPQTLGEDGDPLDVVILNDEPIVAGCLLKLRPIAVIKALQTKGGREIRNDRIVGQAMCKESALKIKILELRPEEAAEMQFFFEAYNEFYGAKFKVIGTGDAVEALELARQAADKEKRRGAK